MKSNEQAFCDWEGSVFGYGYGTGEQYILGDLKRFISSIPGRGEGTYDFQVLEEELTPSVCWFLINALCAADIIEYGTSPRFGWLTNKGERLRDFVNSKILEELVWIRLCWRRVQEFFSIF